VGKSNYLLPRRLRASQVNSGKPTILGEALASARCNFEREYRLPESTVRRELWMRLFPVCVYSRPCCVGCVTRFDVDTSCVNLFLKPPMRPSRSILSTKKLRKMKAEIVVCLSFCSSEKQERLLLIVFFCNECKEMTRLFPFCC